MSKCFLQLLIIGSVLLSVADAGETPPNVILILADDMAIGDFSSRNLGVSKTPKLDQLKTQSVWFEQAYSASCVCAPARAALLTGRYPHRTGVVTLNMYKFPELTRLRQDETTIAEVYQANGYRTGLIGKWHCGLGEDFSPRRHGFDEFEGFAGAEDVGYFRYPLTINDQEVMVDDEYLTDNFSRRAIEFVRRNRRRPFFLHLAHYAPHRPLQAPQERVDFYLNQGVSDKTAKVYAMIEIMDRGIGELLQELKQMHISDRTIVLFASDNGPDPITGTRFNDKLRGSKYQVYEGGIRVPLLVHWEGKLMPRPVDEPVHLVDVFPTLLDLCGIDDSSLNDVDGRSFVPLLKGIPQQHRRTARFWQWNRGVPNSTHNAAVRDGHWKLVRPYVTRELNPTNSLLPPLLFDLSTDPGETTDVASKYPNRVKTMNNALSEWFASVERDRHRASGQNPGSPE